MGCQCSQITSSYESLVDDIFSSIIIRKWAYEEILSELENIKVDSLSSKFTETDFQIFYNRLLFSNSFEHTKDALFAYWIEFFRTKPIKIQATLMKFNLLFLSKSYITDQQSYVDISSYFCDLIKEYKTMKSKNALSKDDEKMVSVEELHFIIKDYIYSVSLQSIEFFKTFHENPPDFRERLTFSWAIEVIDCFAMKTFFSDYESTITKVDVKKFVKMHFNTLKDDNALRKKLTEFSKKFYQNDSNKLLSHSYTMNRLNNY